VDKSPQPMLKVDDLKLLPGERLVFCSRAGGAAGYSQLIHIVGIFTFLQMLGTLMMVILTGPAAMGVSSWATLLVAVTLGALWLRHRIRPAFFLSDRRLFQRRMIGGVESFPLEKIRGCQRYIARYWGRYGTREVMTSRLVLRFSEGPDVLFGPVRAVGQLADLVQGGVIERFVDLRALPALDGDPAPAEARGDLFFSLFTATDGATYGPIFIGPTTLLRFTEELSTWLSSQLLTLVAAQARPEEIEEQVLRLSRHPDAGHVTILEIGEVRLHMEGDTLVVLMEGHDKQIELRPRDAARAAKYLLTQRPVHPMR
jgi:hypothetical protein